MTTHDQGLLAAYCFDALDSSEAEEVALHLRTCPDCQRELEELRELHDIMSEVPSEALLDGEAEDSDLLLARIMRAAEQDDERPAKPKAHKPRSSGWWKRGLLVAAAVVLLAAAFGGGVLTQRQANPTATPANTVTVVAKDPSTGVGMSMDVTKSPGWVSLSGHFTGVKPGTPCDIWVITHAGNRILAGGWTAPANADKATVTVNGSATIDPALVSKIEVTADYPGRPSKHMVSADVT